MMNGGMGWMMVLGMVLFWAVVVALAVLLVNWISGRTQQGSKNRESAIEILKARYARGEVSREDFLRIREEIGENERKLAG